ncbi:coiled-coil domain-containing protein [Xanthomonas campestris]|uniref:hypothetical protein n=1 Tax=Xanthomonas campestris TaxID=339 RepID=UPI002B22A0C8|nr:hypothetical protein [Xanthomonas campestris]MEA9733975.1 hypothetical protein [Xanthomonas campestris pv. raphani]
MKNLLFQRLHLVSHRERKARSVEFHPEVTVIKGLNDVGKSSLAKSIYGTLGAEAAEIHPDWKAASVISALEFTVDGDPYVMLKEGKTFTLIGSDRVLGCYTSITEGLAPPLYELLGAKLRLKNRADKVVVPPPAYLFIPFYVDQDAGWSNPWTSFARLEQFSRWQEDVVNFHVGVTGAEYFEALELQATATAARVEPAKQLDGLRSLQKRAKDTVVEDIDMEIDPDVFSEEIERVVAMLQQLVEVREEERTKLSGLTQRRLQLEAQREILDRVRRELHADYMFAVKHEGEDLECPTCGQLHENSFGQRFALAQDEGRTDDVLVEVMDNLALVSGQIAICRQRLKDATEDEQRFNELLSRRRGQVTFARLLERAGQKRFSSQLDDQVADLVQEIATLDYRIKQAAERLRNARSTERKKEALEAYAGLLTTFAEKLSVTFQDEFLQSLMLKIHETGSDRPRAILAYVYAILHLIWEAEDAVRCPIVLDSPKQQDQDDINHLNLLHFIRDERPSGSQLILLLVDDADVDFGCAPLVLDTKYSLLSGEEYDRTSEVVRGFQAMREMLVQ